MAEQHDDDSPLSEDRPVPADAADGDGVADTEALQAELARVNEELTEAREQVLRVAAEAQNVRRRADKDIEAARKFALERFAGELLPVVDNLERALEAADGENPASKPLLDGVALTRKSFLDVLQKFHIEQIDPVGEPFDPQLHEAMSMVENPDVEPGTVLHVMQKGYTLNGRLIRAAMVMVARGGTDGSGPAGKKVDEQA